MGIHIIAANIRCEFTGNCFEMLLGDNNSQKTLENEKGLFLREYD